MELFLVRPEKRKLRIWTLFMQWHPLLVGAIKCGKKWWEICAGICQRLTYLPTMWWGERTEFIWWKLSLNCESCRESMSRKPRKISTNKACKVSRSRNFKADRILNLNLYFNPIDSGRGRVKRSPPDSFSSVTFLEVFSERRN